MQELLIGTNNPAKLREYREGFADLRLRISSARDMGLSDVPETGATFEENAELKAREYFKQTGLPVVADDGGLEIDALGGKPGVLSRRWVSGREDVSDAQIVAHTLRSMEGLPQEVRGAQFRITAAFFDGAHLELATEVTRGTILAKPRRAEEGFPYRALFLIDRFGKVFDELTEEEHAVINHRVKAIARLKPVIKARLRL